MGHEPLAGMHMLVVEDETLVGMMLEGMLLDFGCTVEVVTSVAKALTAIERHVPDGALLDMNLNGEKTVTVAQELADRSVPFLLVTGYGAASGDAPVVKAAPRLRKPFSQNELKRRMQEVMT